MFYKENWISLSLLICIYMLFICKAQIVPVDWYTLGWVIHCKFQANSYDCAKNGKSEHRYYWDIHMQTCKDYEYAFCEQTLNNFYTLTECAAQCREHGPRVEKNMSSAPEVFCRMQPDFGECNSYHPMFYYDISQRKCRGFSFSGCGGNMNRFRSTLECVTTCSAVIKYPDRDNIGSLANLTFNILQSRKEKKINQPLHY